MTVYTDAGQAETPEEVIARILAGLAAALPGWSTGGEGTLEVALAEEIGRESADLRYLAFVREPARAFREFGTTVAGVPMLVGTAATIPVRLDLVEPGASAPGSLLLVGTSVDGLEVEFTTPPEPVTADAGASSVTVTATATTTGEAGNGVPAGPLVLATSTSAVLGAAATGASVGGSDDESPDAYLTRLVQAQSTLVRSIVLAPDAEIQARTVPGVHRARAVDNYDAETGDTAAERTLSVFALDVDGNPVAGDVRAQLLAYLDSLREVNFQVRVADPTYTPVAVTFEAVAKAGADTGTVLAALRDRAFAILDPGSWGGGDDEPPVWRDERVVRYLDLAGELDRVPGVDYLRTLTLNGGTSDVTLPGLAALPASRAAAAPTTVTGTVEAAS